MQVRQFWPGAERRKKRVDNGGREQIVGTLFENREQLRAFLDVWKWFASVRP
jgi:hypothetical protein